MGVPTPQCLKTQPSMLVLCIVWHVRGACLRPHFVHAGDSGALTGSLSARMQARRGLRQALRTGNDNERRGRARGRRRDENNKSGAGERRGEQRTPRAAQLSLSLLRVLDTLLSRSTLDMCHFLARRRGAPLGRPQPTE